MEVLKCMMEVHNNGFMYMYIETTSIQVAVNGLSMSGEDFEHNRSRS